MLKNPFEQFHEHLLPIQIVGFYSKYYAKKVALKVVAYKIKNIHSHCRHIDDPTVAVEIFQITSKHELHEYYRINTLLPFLTIILLGEVVEEAKIKLLFKMAVHIIDRDLIR
ncbi:MAG: hypothetical protein P0Y49_09650 [Candidatus Pedobacter colombiensis]|uniref:Uncharacterized protein n=1 Tax=Candidatus Pedobacter colombiensis TaxID=3121371 RepID=A0AAJ5WF43_9SPHI|nr:hypothetical protein [Pedobacter sp.]WEK21402.1 MAG: hypothetical protein P0Y49_09650 [Pedobacter sp.]